MSEDCKLSFNLRKFITPYLTRIMEFYDYDKENLNSLHNSLRHIEILRNQIDSEYQINKDLTEYDKEFLASIVSDSYFFEKNTNETLEFRIHFLRLTWNRILIELGIVMDDSKLIVVKNAYSNSSQMVDGRTVYKKYEKS